MSLWHRIFGLPEQQVKKITEGPASDEPADAEESRETVRSDSATTYRDEVVEESSYVEEVEFDEPGPRETSEEPASEEEGEPRRRRPRRRRRGRGGRKSEEAGDREKRPSRDGERSAEVEPKSGPRRHAAPDDMDLDDDEEEDLDSNFLDEDEADDESEVGEGEEKRDPGKTVPLSHRNIPTWEEAIGVIVDANSQTRSERKRSPHPPSRGGSARGGRARGGRRKKKP